MKIVFKSTFLSGGLRDNIPEMQALLQLAEVLNLCNNVSLGCFSFCLTKICTKSQTNIFIKHVLAYVVGHLLLTLLFSIQTICVFCVVSDVAISNSFLTNLSVWSIIPGPREKNYKIISSRATVCVTFCWR